MKSQRMSGWKRHAAAAFLTMLFLTVLPVPLEARAEEAGLLSAFVQMPGCVLEQWNRVRPMAVSRGAAVYAQPDRKTAVLGRVKAGQSVNAWGQTDTGWYFIVFGDGLGFVRYENAYFVDTAGMAAEQPAQAQQAASAAAKAQQEQAQQEAQEAEQPAAAAPVVFIGDSRMVTLKEAVERSLGVCPVAVVAENRSRYEWFHDTGIPRADKVIGKGSRVVINMGVNDLHDVDKYLADVNAWGAVWTARGASVYYASVNPVYANPYEITEEKVGRFNESLSSRLIPQIVWLDSNTWLKQCGVHSTDGLHYGDDTNLLLYQFYMTMIGMQ